MVFQGQSDESEVSSVSKPCPTQGSEGIRVGFGALYTMLYYTTLD